GQPYWLRLIDKYEDDVVVRSTLLILFHEPAHRKVASDYWKFWRSQQPNPQTARAIFLDEQCPPEGIYNVRFPSFDRIEFEWNSRMGAKMLIKFNCLSTDFSRIKGVKGIPLRVQMESREINAQYVEQSYCKIKLFRDKGAERKNKDDAKQIWKHMERIYGKSRPFPSNH
ncbi:CP2 transcription factor, partial [Dichotomocladium elegans]